MLLSTRATSCSRSTSRAVGKKLLPRGWNEAQQIRGDHARFTEFCGSEITGEAVQVNGQSYGFEGGG